MELQDYSKQNQEQKEQQEREFYENAKTEMNEAFENVISQAYEDGITHLDILESMKNGFENCNNDVRIKIERLV